MKKKADWTIEDCMDCEHFICDDQVWDVYRCVHKSKRGRKINDNNTDNYMPIPKWCPLEDAEE